ncbi:MAG: hypothetical protein LAP87_10410 [Acidobacteriia bacterium]|nr:hypothetical protein [Terriglobia bacterium]
MTVAEALARGVRTLKGAKRLWFLFYAANLLAAAVAAAAAMSVPFQYLGHSAWAAQMVGNFDIQWLAEIFAASGGLSFQPVAAAMACAWAISGIVSLFLLGGAIHVFCARAPFAMKDFFAGCGKHFWRLARLTIYSAIFYIAVFVVGGLLSFMGRKLWGEGSAATPLVYGSWFRAAVLICLLGFVGLAFDYARISLVAEDSRKAFRTAFRSFRFVWRNLRRTVALYVMLWVIAVALIAAYFGVSLVVPQTSMAMVLLLLLVRQATMIARMWSRLLFYASQVEMYDFLKPAPLLPPEPEAAPEEVPTALPEAEVVEGGAAPEP